MLKDVVDISTSRAALILLSSTLALADIACSSDKLTSSHRDNALPVAKESAPEATAIPKLSASPVLPEKVELESSQPSPYELALDKGYSAFSISQSAESSDDWNLVVSQWTDAIALLKAVLLTSPHKAIAQTKIAEYQRNRIYAQQQANRPIKKNPHSVIAVIPEVLPSSLRTSGIAAVEAPPMPPQPVFQALIKRRISRTPVIGVTFNGTKQFEMIVDTGASGTVITQQMAAALGVVPVAKAKANTASARNVEFSIGYVDSIQVGGAVVKDVSVAIAPSAELETGLLGHDFFGEYDVTIKRDVVEFRPR